MHYKICGLISLRAVSDSVKVPNTYIQAPTYIAPAGGMRRLGWSRQPGPRCRSAGQQTTHSPPSRGRWAAKSKGKSSNQKSQEAHPLHPNMRQSVTLGGVNIGTIMQIRVWNFFFFFMKRYPHGPQFHPTKSCILKQDLQKPSTPQQGKHDSVSLQQTGPSSALYRQMPRTILRLAS